MKFLKCEILYQGVVMAESKSKARAVELAKAAADGYGEDVTVNAYFQDDEDNIIERAVSFDRWGNCTKLWLIEQKKQDVFQEGDDEQEADDVTE